jgi:hypothetical protein
MEPDYEPDSTPRKWRDTSDDDVPDDREQWEREADFERECAEIDAQGNEQGSE